MRKLGMKMYIKTKGIKELLNNEKGAQSLEWLGIAALLIMIVGVVGSFLTTNESRITDIIGNILTEIEGQIGG